MTHKTLGSILTSFGTNLIFKPETVSTNADARLLAKSGVRIPTVILADRQTGGKGRAGKSFESPAGGLYMTLLIPSGEKISHIMGATSCAAVAVCRSLKRVYGVDCGIKWVNDIFYEGGKLCGILTESVNDYNTMTSEYLMIGVGVNTGGAPSVECGYKVSSLNSPDKRFELCAEITKELIFMANSRFDLKSCIDEYRRLSLVIGRELTFTENGTEYRGTAEGITDSASLIVKCQDGIHELKSGEISIRF